MNLVVGLGNPGREYEATRHNLGFMLIDRLFERAGGYRFRVQSQAKVGEVTLAGVRVLLVKPQTFMNLSGDSVLPLLERYGSAESRNLIVACDDIALPFGMLRVRREGGAGGQKGLQSIIERLGSKDFARVRLGIKPEHPVADLSSFVLAPIPKRDREELDRILDRAGDAVETIITSGVDVAMKQFNERVRPVKSEPELAVTKQSD
jgi:peptidyl-tRNA hydrolase, PTH1 family